MGMIRSWLSSLWWSWKTRREDQALELTVRLREVTYQRFERACLMVGLDPDKVRAGDQSVEDADIGDVFETAPELIRTICTNHRRLTLVVARAEKPAAEAVVAHVLTYFFFRCLVHFAKQAQSYATTPTDAR